MAQMDTLRVVVYLLLYTLLFEKVMFNLDFAQI